MEVSPWLRFRRPARRRWRRNGKAAGSAFLGHPGESPRGRIHIMNIGRTTAGINKAGALGLRTDKSTPPMRCGGLPSLAKPLEFHGWICRKTLCGRMPATFLNKSGDSLPRIHVSGRFCVSETIIPEAQEHFLALSARGDTHLFGGLRLGQGEVGIEPTTLGPEPSVLPLNYPPLIRQSRIYWNLPRYSAACNPQTAEPNNKVVAPPDSVVSFMLHSVFGHPT